MNPLFSPKALLFLVPSTCGQVITIHRTTHSRKSVICRFIFLSFPLSLQLLLIDSPFLLCHICLAHLLALSIAMTTSSTGVTHQRWLSCFLLTPVGTCLVILAWLSTWKFKEVAFLGANSNQWGQELMSNLPSLHVLGQQFSGSFSFPQRASRGSSPRCPFWRPAQ